MFLAIAALVGALFVGYVCGSMWEGIFYNETLMSTTSIKDSVKLNFDIVIPDEAMDLNCFISSTLDSEYYLSFKLDEKRLDDFIKTLPGRYDVQQTAEHDMPQPYSRQNHDISWWQIPDSSDAKFFFGSGQVSIVYDTRRQIVYLYCFTT